jgi:glycosyltransferase involved in cell wall biosynthesis
MDKKFRVLMVAACPFPFPRGTPIRIQRMAESLAINGHEVHVATYHLGEHQVDTPYTIHRIIRLPFYNKLDPGPSVIKLLLVDPLLTIKLIRLIAKYKFDIIYAHHFEGFICALPSRLLVKRPVVFDIHTLLEAELPYYGPSRTQGLLSRIGKIFDTTLPVYADHVVGISEEIVNKVSREAHVPPEKISLISNGVELELFMTAQPDRDRLDNKGIILAYAGNFARYQGIETMLKALSLLKETNQGITLKLISKNDLSAYQPLLRELGIERQINHIQVPFSELPQQLANADILVNPRFASAGYPLKLLNYMAAGKPVITMSGTSHKTIHGQTGWVVEGSAPADLAVGIQYLIDHPDLREQLGKNARRYVEENFMWVEKTRQLELIFEGLVSMPSGYH